MYHIEQTSSAVQEALRISARIESYGSLKHLPSPPDKALHLPGSVPYFGAATGYSPGNPGGTHPTWMRSKDSSYPVSAPAPNRLEGYQGLLGA